MVINTENPETGGTEDISIHAFMSCLGQADAVTLVTKALPVPIQQDHPPGTLPGTDEHYLGLTCGIRVRIFPTGPSASTIFIEAPLEASNLNGRVVAFLRQVRGLVEATVLQPKKPKLRRSQSAQSVQRHVERILARPEVLGKVLLCDESQRDLHTVFFNRLPALDALLNQLAAAALTMNKGPLGTDTADFFVTKLGMKGFRPHLSDTQRLKFKKDYIGTHKAESFLGEWHCTLFDGPNVLSVHFVYSAKHRAILITRFGDHGRTHQDPK